jgi:alkylated DNA repair protein alkB family protein 1
MSGPACRRAYHGWYSVHEHYANLPGYCLLGVPRVLEGTLPPHFDAHLDDEIAWKPYQEYMRTTRINVNVRQVFPTGFDPVQAAVTRK